MDAELQKQMLNFSILETDAGAIRALRYFNENQHNLLVAAYRDPRPSYKELATEFSIPLNTVKTRLNRAKLRIIGWRKGEVLP